MKQVPIKKVDKLLYDLYKHTASVAYGSQKYLVPIIATNDSYEATSNKMAISIEVAEEYRYNGHWFSYKYSDDKPSETVSILKVDNVFTTSQLNQIPNKYFIGTINSLTYEGLIRPFLLIIDGKIVSWDRLEFVFDSGDTWLLIRDGEFNKYALSVAKSIKIILLPFKCEFFGTEPDDLFETYYAAFCKYIQETSYVKGTRFFISSPTLQTSYEYNHMLLNLGGWAYTQIKRYALGLLSIDRINLLRQIPVNKTIFNSSGVAVDQLATKFNLFDMDVPTDTILSNYLYGVTVSNYDEFPCFCFNDNGGVTDDGDSRLYIMSDNIEYRDIQTEDNYTWDLSDVEQLLFRENFLVFRNGVFDDSFAILMAPNNVVHFSNPNKEFLTVVLVYNTNLNKVIRNSDTFYKSYMAEQAKRYFELLQESWSQNGETPLNSSTEVAAMPSLLDYSIYLENLTEDENDAVDTIPKLLEPLNFKIDNKSLFSENHDMAMDAIIKYNPALLNPAYKTAVDQVTFMGKQANESLIYDFMYENRHGLKIPRKLYKDHETYFMLFVNGELYEGYSKTIAYANFFFIPVEDDFKFDESDIIEILYFKNVNNNEIRFYLSDWLLEQLQDHDTDATFYDIDIFKRWIRSSELKVFSHYPRDMIHYPTLVTEESEEIAFNISYRDENDNLCLKKTGLTHIVSEDIRQLIEATGQTIPEEIDSVLDTLTVDEYKNVLKDNTFIIENGVNIFSRDHKVTRNALVATSCHKFIYQRLDVDRMSYRILLDKRFRYCDNPRQYLLFINGRRMRQDSFLVTIPKHTLPFNAMYLYTAKFVGAGDRVELFYLPYDMTDINFDEDRRYFFQENGYLQISKDMLDVPLSRELYMFFINGKKIPASTIVDVDSHTVRVAIDTTTTHYPMITAINTNGISEVESYMHNTEEFSQYDAFIQFVKNRDNSFSLLDKLFNTFVQLSDTEGDKIWMNVAKIAILNEVIRDFWVTSGYDYHSQPFIYDYDDNEYFTKDANGNLILTALDGIPEINIRRNDISLLYFYTNPIDLLIEFGREIDKLQFFWEYSQRFNQGDWQILSQSINGIPIPVEDRSWETTDIPDYNKWYKFVANTGQQFITHSVQLTRANGTYWGMVDEEELQYYHRTAITEMMDELVAVVPKDHSIPSRERLELESGNPAYRQQIEDLNTIVYGLEYGDEYDQPIDLWRDPSLQDIDEDEYLAICLDGRRFYNPQPGQIEMDRADDVLYTYPGVILYDGRFVSDLDLAESHEINHPTQWDWDAVNIMSTTFWAETESRGNIYDLTYAEDWHIMPQPETIYDITNAKYFAIIEPNQELGEHLVVKPLELSDMKDISTPSKDYNHCDFDLFDPGFMAIIPHKPTASEEIRMIEESKGLMNIELDEFQIIDLDTGEDLGIMSFAPNDLYHGPLIIYDLNSHAQLYGVDWFTVNADTGQLELKDEYKNEGQRWHNLFADYKFSMVKPSDLVVSADDLLGLLPDGRFMIDISYDSEYNLHPVDNGVHENDFLINHDGFMALPVTMAVNEPITVSDIDQYATYPSTRSIDTYFTIQTTGYLELPVMENLDVDEKFIMTRPNQMSLEVVSGLEAIKDDVVFARNLEYEDELVESKLYDRVIRDQVFLLSHLQDIDETSTIVTDLKFPLSGADIDTGERLQDFLYYDIDRNEYLTLNESSSNTSSITYSLQANEDFMLTRPNRLNLETFIDLQAHFISGPVVKDLTYYKELSESQQYEVDLPLIVDSSYDFTGTDLETGEEITDFLFFDLDNNYYITFEPSAIGGKKVDTSDTVYHNDVLIDSISAFSDTFYAESLNTEDYVVGDIALLPEIDFAEVSSVTTSLGSFYGVDLDTGEEYTFGEEDYGIDEDGNRIYAFDYTDFSEEQSSIDGPFEVEVEDTFDPLSLTPLVIDMYSPNSIFAVPFYSTQTLQNFSAVDLDTGEIYEFGSEDYAEDESGDKLYLFNYIDYDTKYSRIEPLDILTMNENPDEFLVDPTNSDFMALTAEGTITGLQWRPVTEKYSRPIEVETYLVTGNDLIAYVTGESSDGSNLIAVSLDDSESFNLVGALMVDLDTGEQYSIDGISDDYGEAEYTIEGLQFFYEDSSNEAYWDRLFDPTHESMLAIFHDGSGIYSEFSIEPVYETKSKPLEVEALLLDGLSAYVTIDRFGDFGLVSVDLDDDSKFYLSGGFMLDLDTGEEFPIDITNMLYEETIKWDELTYESIEKTDPKKTLFDPTYESMLAIFHDGSRIIDDGLNIESMYYTKTIETPITVYLLDRLEAKVFSTLDGSTTDLGGIDLETGAQISLDGGYMQDLDTNEVFPLTNMFEEPDDPEFIVSFFDLQPLTWNTDFKLNVFDITTDGFTAIMHDGSDKVSGLTYLIENNEPEKLRNFFNLDDGEYLAELEDGTTINDIGYITTREAYDPSKHLVIDIDAEWMRVIDSNDKITKEHLIYLNNLTEQIRWLPMEFIDQEGWSIIVDADEGEAKVVPFDDMTWSANEKSKIRRNIGFYDFETNKGLMMAIMEGTARVVHGLDYKIDGLADNRDIVVYDYDDKLFAVTLDGQEIHNFTYENHEYSWSNKKLVNIADDDFMAIFKDDGNIARNLFFVYDPNQPQIRHYYDESNLANLIRNLDKYLVKEPPHIKLKRYVWGNNRYFVFACPKRVVYHDWHCRSRFFLPSPTSQEVLSKCFGASTPIYTNGKKGESTGLLNDLSYAEMEYMGETYFTNDYGYTEPYMVWKSNGYFTRLNAAEGLDMTIEIGVNDTHVTFYDRVRESLINTGGAV